MPKRRSPFADIPPITDFESCQKARPLMLHAVGDVLGVWRDCKNPTCRRRKSCRRSDWDCLATFMQALPDQDRRYLRYCIENRVAGFSVDEACQRAYGRIAEEIARFGE